MNKTYDLVIIGAGSIGLPAALICARKGLKVLVIDALPSPGQGENKRAIGGIRATHSDRAKILVCQRSIEMFATWRETYGDDIHWRAHGYSFPAYGDDIEARLKELLEVQQGYGLNIHWISPEEYRELVPSINMNGLNGSTYSPEDGSASPLLFIESAYAQALAAGVDFRFKEKVTGFEMNGRRITGVRTDKDRYEAAHVLNAAGSSAKGVGQLAGCEVQVNPDCHEAAVSEAVKPFMGPMVVDVRKRPGSASFYFYQLIGGQVIFCFSVDPPILGTDHRATSSCLPMVAKRALDIMPRLANLKIRRTWRGTYPMTPDGFPMVGVSEEFENFYLAVGMCGQGFMLGPGVAEIIHRLITETSTPDDREILESFNPYRTFSAVEAFK